jgi:oxygen-independent coproporphyrinogen-3 oxidase
MQIDRPSSEAAARASFAPAAWAAERAPAGLYVHIPFCSAICPYCDFAVVRSRRADHQPFLRRLAGEAARYSQSATVFDSIYLGGGTPSALHPEALAELVAMLRGAFRLDQEVRLSIEVNPEDVDAGSVDAWRGLGIHTVSLGVQALDDATLRFLGRRHRRREALAAIALVRAAGFAAVSVDLIYAVPGQTVEHWRAVLEQVAAMGVDHLSCYELTVHEGTPFERWRARGDLRLPEDRRRYELFLATHRSLEDLGLIGYEVSNFARSRELRSRHNQKYWHHAPYLGLGPSAHSFDGRRRWWNRRGLRDYLERDGEVADSEEMTPEGLELETVLFGVRTTDGIGLEDFEQRFGEQRRCQLEVAARRALADRQLLHSDGRLVPTLAGMAVADALAVELTRLR